MWQKQGFLLFEVALALLIISVLSAVIGKTLAQIYLLQSEIKCRGEALNCLNNYYEQVRQGVASSQPLSSSYRFTIQKKTLNFAGQWSLDLTNQERQQLCSAIECSCLTVEWAGSACKNRSYTVFTAQCNRMLGL